MPLVKCNSCNHHYEEGRNYVEGLPTRCPKCHKGFSQQTCPHCKAQLTILPPKGKKHVRQGGTTECCECLKTFTQISCPHCRRSNVFRGEYSPGQKVKCWSCFKQFQHLSCPFCDKDNFFSKANHIEGQITPCVGCKRKFQHVTCPHCSTAQFWKNCNYPEGNPVKCAGCKKEFQSVACPHCTETNYWKDCSHKPGAIVTCLHCSKRFQQICCHHCLASLESADLTYRETRLTTCPSCEVSFRQVNCVGCKSSVVLTGANAMATSLYIPCKKCHYLNPIEATGADTSTTSMNKLRLPGFPHAAPKSLKAIASGARTGASSHHPARSIVSGGSVSSVSAMMNKLLHVSPYKHRHSHRHRTPANGKLVIPISPPETKIAPSPRELNRDNMFPWVSVRVTIGNDINTYCKAVLMGKGKKMGINWPLCQIRIRHESDPAMICGTTMRTYIHSIVMTNTADDIGSAHDLVPVDYRDLCDKTKKSGGGDAGGSEVASIPASADVGDGMSSVAALSSRGGPGSEVEPSEIAATEESISLAGEDIDVPEFDDPVDVLEEPLPYIPESPEPYYPEPEPYYPEPEPYIPEPEPYIPEPEPYIPEPTPYIPEPTPWVPAPAPPWNDYNNFDDGGWGGGGFDDFGW